MLYIRALIVLSVLGCHGTADRVDAANGAGETPSKAAAAKSVTADPGPVFERKTGVREAVSRDPIEVRADGIARDDRAIYLRVAMPRDISALVNGVLISGRLQVEGDRYGLAVPAGEGRIRDRPLAFVRLVGKEAPGELTLRWTQPATAEGQPGQVQTLRVVELADAPDEGVVRERFYEAASRWFESRSGIGAGRRDPFLTFASARLRILGGLEEKRTQGGVTRTRRGDMGDLMALYTGLTSVEEALQSDRGLRLPPDFDTARKVPLAEVRALDLPGHPWDQLISDLGKEPVIEPLASYTPADMLYVHFHDLRTLVKLADELDEMVTPVTRVLEERPGPRHFVRRYERQLAVERLGLAKTLGHVAAKGVSLVSSDPFFREGTDVTLMFHVRNAGALQAALATYEKRASERRPDAKVGGYRLGEHEVRTFTTADREVFQHRLELGDVLLLSNSPRALERVVAAHAGREISLARSGDFRYFRTRYPFDPASEDGFAFLSDAFVLHSVGPRVKVLQARRMVAMADLYAAGYAALLHGWLEGRAPANVAELKAAKLLTDADLRHEDGRGPIDLDLKRGASSEAWGRPAALRPLIELDLDAVTEREAGEYNRFRETYQRYWRGFVDPVGVHIRRRDDGVDLEAVMMPLIQSSEYNDLERLVGRARMKTAPLAEGVRLSLAIPEDSKLRAEIDQLGRMTTNSRDIGIGWLGDWVMVGVGDRSGLWDVALAVGDVPTKDGRRAYAELEARKRVWDRFPLYVGAHVRDRLALAATLTAIKAFANSAAPGIVEWGEGGTFRDVPIVTLKEKLGEQRPGEKGIELQYAVAGDVFLASLDRGTLEQQIAAALDGKVPKPAKPAEGKAAQSILAVKPGGPRSWLSRTLLGVLERGTVAGNRAAFRAYEALALGLRGTLPKDGDALDQAALDWLGYVPEAANGGRFELKGGAPSHTLYGTEYQPRFPEIPVEGSAVAAFVNALDELRLTLSFEGEGAHRGLRSTVRWRRR